MSIPKIQQTPRNALADFLKGIAVLGLIQVHVTSLFGSEQLLSTLGGRYMQFLGAAPVAPVLMLIFGYFVAKSQRSPQQLLWRSLKLFLLGMCLNVALNFNLIRSVFENRFHVNIWPYLLGVDILHFAALALLVLLVFKIWKRYSNWVIVLLILVVIVVAEWIRLKAFSLTPAAPYLSAYFFRSEQQWAYFSLVPWLAYPLCGFLFYKLEPFVIRTFVSPIQTRKYLALLLFIVVGITFPYAPGFSSSMAEYYQHSTWFFCWCVLFASLYVLCGYIILPYWMTYKPIRYLIWLGQHITTVYVIQWLIIGNTATEVYKSTSSVKLVIMASVLVVFISSCLTFVVIKLGKSEVTAFREEADEI